VISTFKRPPVQVDPALPYVQALRAAAAPHTDGQVRDVVGRDGASDVVSFQRVGIPAVEFGPVGAGHHGPEEWVSLPSLAAYREAIVDFARGLPLVAAGGDGDDPGGAPG
jgi:succinyl-diaminopimelate desuccinylase